MRQGALLDRWQLFLSAAVLAAQASFGKEGFRQRDVLFLAQLFSNWIEHTLGHAALELHNTHLHRFLEQLTAEGFAAAQRRAKQPRYSLTRVGLLELIQRVAAEPPENWPGEFLFRCFFLKSYRERIVELVQREGRQFPPSIRLELEALLDVKELIRGELRRVDVELKKLEDRLQSCIASANLARRRFAQGATHAEVFEEIEEKHPYELNSQKPMSELLSQMPVELGRWELEQGHLIRASDIWRPSLALLRCYRDQLRLLAEQ